MRGVVRCRMISNGNVKNIGEGIESRHRRNSEKPNVVMGHAVEECSALALVSLTTEWMVLQLNGMFGIDVERRCCIVACG